MGTCPAIRDWQDFILDRTNRMIDRYEIDGIYIDCWSWGGEKSEVFHLVMLFIFVPQVTHFTRTVDVLTAKRLYPGAQGRRRAPLQQWSAAHPG